MKKDANLKMLLAAFCLLFGLSAVNAQSGNDDLINAKLQHQADQLNAADEYQQSMTNTSTKGVEVTPQPSLSMADASSGNSIISTNVADGWKTCEIQLGWNLANAQEASDYKEALAEYPGVLSVTADHNNNTVSITFKDSNEWPTLVTLFNIQN